MRLHVETTGCGAPLVLLHGWGMHGGMWGDAVARLAQSYTVHNVDLPGHGFSVKQQGRSAAVLRDCGLENTQSPSNSWAPTGVSSSGAAVTTMIGSVNSGAGRGKREGIAASPLKGNGEAEVLPFPLPPSHFSMDAIVADLSARFDEPVNLCGWSLGGQVALHWALREPAGIHKLIVVASTPCFTVRETWPCAMPREVLEKFAAELEQDPVATLRRFITLQLRGSDKERELLARMREQLFRRGQPEREALRAGLAILRDADQRGELAQIGKPTLVIAGQRDKLTPPEAAHFLAHAMPNARLVEIAGAAHVPFLSHPELFVEHVERFLNEPKNRS